MAFFATIEDLPSAKASQWEPRQRNPRPNPRERRPPVRPPRKPRTIPPRTPRGRQSDDGQARVRRPVSRFVRVVARRKTPFEETIRIRTNDQLRGRRKPARTPPAIREDRKPTRRTTRGFIRGRYRFNVDENPWNNIP